MNQIATPVVKASTRRYYPLLEMVLCRLREFIREPEAVFWVYGFPMLMTLALGIAFKEKPVEEFCSISWPSRKPPASRKC